MIQPLANRRFLVTRPESQSERLAHLLREAGAIPLLAPMITIGEASAPEALDAALARLSDVDLVVFVSPTALDKVAERIHSWPDELPVAVVGPTSRERALALGMREVISPESRYDSEGLLEHPAMHAVAGKRVMLFRGNGGRELLADTLIGRGAIVEIVEAYRRQPPGITQDELAALLSEGCDGVIVTSSEAVQNLFTLAQGPLTDTLRAQMFFTSHPAIAEAVRAHEVRGVHGTAAGDAGIVATLAECFAVAPTGSSTAASNPAPVTSAVPKAAAPSVAPVNHSATMLADTSAAAAKQAREPWVPAYVKWALATGVVCLGTTLMLYRTGSRDIHGEMGQQLASIESLLRDETARNAKQDAHVSQIDARMTQLEQRLEDIHSQQADLRALYSSVAGDQEEALLADAELTLSLASQQLQLTGNVGAALAAMYRLDDRLAGYDQARLAPVRRALARDIDALKRVPWVDYVGLSAKLDALAVSVDQLPLVVGPKSPEEAKQEPDTRTDGLLGDFGRAINALISIRRIDQPDPVLLTPSQELYLREHVKMRLLNARLALLQRDEATFHQDLSDAETQLRSHFDLRAKPVAAALATLRDVAAARPALQLPNLSDSVSAARDARRTVQKGDKS